MEILAVGLVAITTVWFFGFLGSIRKVADMANNQVATVHAEHLLECAKKMQQLGEQDAEKVVEEAKKVSALFNGLSL